MNCQECEAAIYTFREISEVEQQEVQRHISDCEKCGRLFQEVTGFFQVIEKASQEKPVFYSAGQLTDKVMNKVMQSSKEDIRQTRTFSLFDLSVSRWALAAVSCGILIMFFIEILVPDLKSGKIKGPVANLQGAIIKSEDFRKAFTRPKEKKSLFQECRNILSNQIDPNCVKEKISKANF